MQILFGYLEPVVRSTESKEPFSGLIGEHARPHENAVRLVTASSHAASKLMELGQPEAFRMFDYHDGGVRHIHADLDHGS